jgi:hypothetical protein
LGRRRRQCARHPAAIEAQFFHVGVLRAFQTIHRRPPEIRAELAEQLRMGQEFILQGFIKRLKLGIEGIVE